MLGLPSGQVLVVAYDPQWKTAFMAEQAHLLHVCGDHEIVIEHIGSTSVAGLPAKPILDIAIGLPTLEDRKKLIPLLEELGYVYKGENGIPGRQYFTRGTPRTHHVHMVLHRGEIWNNHLLFRNYLRKFPAERDRYARLKQTLSAQFPHDRLSYTESKSDWIQATLQKARTLPDDDEHT